MVELGAQGLWGSVHTRCWVAVTLVGPGNTDWKRARGADRWQEAHRVARENSVMMRREALRGRGWGRHPKKHKG